MLKPSKRINNSTNLSQLLSIPSRNCLQISQSQRTYNLNSIFTQRNQQSLEISSPGFNSQRINANILLGHKISQRKLQINQQIPLISPKNTKDPKDFLLKYKNYSSIYEKQDEKRNLQQNISVYQNTQIANVIPILNKKIIVKRKSIAQIRNQSIKNNQEVLCKEVPSNNDFTFLTIIGVGGYGKVWKVMQNNKIFAMKEMSKKLLLLKSSAKSIMNEKELLSILDHRFIINMHQSFQDQKSVYLVLDYASGGDLRYHLGRQKTFNEEQTKFLVACVALGLEYLHNQNIIHRDLKPENLVLNNNGYVRITDLGIARLQVLDNSEDTSGTPGYMAPEVLQRQIHTTAVDYYALGVITHEFMTGRRPFYGKTRQDYRIQLSQKQVLLKPSDLPLNWSDDAADFINKLLSRKPSGRLGFSHSSEIKYHPWFRNFSWKKLNNNELEAPFKPQFNADNFDTKQLAQEDQDNQDFVDQSELQDSMNGFQEVFKGYEYRKPY